MLPFAKYQGTGNDFVIVDARPLPERASAAWAELARQMCDRHFGAGADGLLLVLAATSEWHAASAGGAALPGSRLATRDSQLLVRHAMRMFNPDGSEAEMCGNGLRCFVRFLLDHGEIAEGQVAVSTATGVLPALVARRNGTVWVTVDMGPPRPLERESRPIRARLRPGPRPRFLAPLSSASPLASLQIVLKLDGTNLPVTCLSVGNPHAVTFVEDVASFPLERLGPQVEQHPAFSHRTNFEACQVVSPALLRVRVWERGAGATLACGTGACAAVVAARLHGYTERRADVALPGGSLEVSWSGQKGEGVLLSGPAQGVYSGTWPRDGGPE